MSKKIDSLISDIYALIGSGKEVSDESVKALSERIAKHIKSVVEGRAPSVGLRASQLGTKCDRKTWYNQHKLEEQEKLQPWVYLKFLFGHIHEELVLFLAEQAGHSVSHQQVEIEYKGVPGHPDAIIDGCLVDVKSANSRGMAKFRTNNLRNDDPFGYLEQLDFYRLGLQDDPSLVDKKNIYFIAADKEMGHLVLDKYERDKDDLDNIKNIVEHKKNIVQLDEKNKPKRHYEPVPDGRSGNMQLDIQCRYCDFKKTCWPELRVFKYSNGPRFLTKVVKMPDVPEIVVVETDEENSF